MLEPCLFSPLVALPVRNVSNPLLNTYILGVSPTACLQVMFTLCENGLWFKPTAWSSSCLTLVVILYSSVHQFISSWFYLSPPSPPSVVTFPNWNLFVWKPFHTYDNPLCHCWYLRFFKTCTWSGTAEIKIASRKNEASHGPLISCIY